MAGELKPGHRTSEFYVTLLAVVGLVAAAAATSLPPRYAAIGSAVSVAAYTLSRGLAKMFPPKDS